MFILKDCSINLSRAWWLGLVTLASVTSPALAQNSSFPEDTISPSRNASTLPNNLSNTIPSSNQYLVYVSGNSPELLQQVKTVAPDAFTGKLETGQSVVQVGRFSNLNFASRRAEQLKQMGLAADVATVSPKVASIAPVAGSYAPIGSAPTNAIGVPNFPPNNAPVSSSNDGFNLPGVPVSSDQQTIEINRPQQSSMPIAPQLPVTTASINPPPEVSRNRYFVIIPTAADAVLQKAKGIVPTARLTASERGTYIEVQGYPERGSAEALNNTIRSQGLNSRVIYY